MLVLSGAFSEAGTLEVSIFSAKLTNCMSCGTKVVGVLRFSITPGTGEIRHTS